MWEVTVVKQGVGVVTSFGFRSRSEAVIKRDELKAEYPDCGVMLEWWN
jgi:hypothetical protein